MIKNSALTKSDFAQRGIAPLILVIIAGAVIVGIFVVSKGVGNKNDQQSTQKPPESSQKSEPVKQESSSGSASQSDEWETYKSDKYGYSVNIPKGWKVTDTPSENSREITIIHPGAQAIILITGLKDEKLKDLNYMKDSIKAFKEKIKKDPSTLQLAKFADTAEGDTGGFVAIGEEKRNGVNWYFDQRGILKTDGRILLFHGAAQSNVYKQYKDIISQIIDSFRAEGNEGGVKN